MKNKKVADFQRETDEIINTLSMNKELKSLGELKEEIDFIDNLNIDEIYKEQLKTNTISKKILSDENEIAYYKAMKSLFESVNYLEAVVNKNKDLTSPTSMMEAYLSAVRVGYFLRSRKDYLNKEMKEKIEGNVIILNRKDFQKEIWSFKLGSKVSEIYEIPRICAALLGIFNSVIHNKDDANIYFKMKK